VRAGRASTTIEAVRPHAPLAARLLVVDDEPANVDVLVRIMTRLGYDVASASDGAGALAAVAERAPDIVLLDVNMPGVDGFEVCRRLKADPATRLIPIILVTALAATEDRVRGIEAGADDFITKPFVKAELEARVRSLTRLKRYTDELDSAESVILTLALTIEARDPYTHGHCERLARYASGLGEQLGLGEHERLALYRGGYLHDIGKVGVPDAILLKVGPLLPAERLVMEQHTVIGDRLCGELRALHDVRPIVRHHHERDDGSGYPDGLTGDATPLLARIMSVVDAFDAMTTDRPYKPARTAEGALQELRAEVRKGWRSGELVEALAAFVAERVQ
jgi:putative two-component system response regulator